MVKLFLSCFLIIFIIPSESITQIQTENTIGTAFSIYNFDYTEEVPPPLKSAELGWLPSLRLEYNYRGIETPIWFNLEFDYSGGKTDYDGSTQLGTPVKAKTDNTLIRIGGNLGFIFRPEDTQYSLTFYSGVRYSYWDRFVARNNPGGIEEFYSWWNIPVGIRTDLLINQELSIGCDISMNIMLSGKMEVDLEGIFGFKEIFPEVNNPILNLGNKLGWKLSIPIDYKFSEIWTLAFTPWYEYSAIGKSNTKTLYLEYEGFQYEFSFYEPSSSTCQFGMDLSLKFNF